ncbi:MAG TPA: arabinofuranosyltransferase [Actinoallomurus sp.]
MPTAGSDVERTSAEPLAVEAGRSWRRSLLRPLTALRHPGVVAVLVWAIVAPVAAGVPSRFHLDPFVQADADVPLVLGGFVAAVLVCLALWIRRPAVTGAAAGLFASWTALLLRTAWQGTPFPAGGLYGDAARLAAMATRYTVTSASSDGIVAGVPSEYPPLYPWLIGKAAVLLHTEAWRLLAPAAIIAVSLSIVLGFVLWSRLTSPGAALMISALGLIAYGKPDKAYEVLALAIVVPLLLLTVGSPERGRPHWLVAGLIGGLMALTYYAYLLYAALGILILVWRTWRTEPSRRAYAWYLGRVVAVMLAVSLWYLIPYARAMTHGGQQLGDLFPSSQISGSPLPFLAMTPLGVAQLIGLAGLLWLRRSVSWAPPLLAIVLGAYGYYLISFARYVTTGHTGLLHYAFALISACLLSAAVLTAFHVAPALARRTATPIPRGAGAAAVTIVVVFAGYTYWHAEMPGVLWTPGAAGEDRLNVAAGGASNVQAARAHSQADPDGIRPRFSGAASQVAQTRWFPAGPVQRAVESVLGAKARPRTLSYDEQLFAFLPWRGYIGVERTASGAPVRWDDRYAELTRLSQITDPAAFAQASAHTRFGPIDVFVLHWEKPDLVWQPLGLPTMLRFQPRQFDPQHFVTVDRLPGNAVVAIRR